MFGYTDLHHSKPNTMKPPKKDGFSLVITHRRFLRNIYSEMNIRIVSRRKQSFRQHLKARRIARKTPPKYGSDQTGNIKTQLERFKPRYSTETYRKAVQRAQQRVYRQMHSIVGALNDRQEQDFKANFRWFPNQLRHEGATKARAKVGLEGAQQVCGHSSKRTTEIYAEQNLELAEDFARECG